MSKRIQPRNNPILKLLLLGCSVPLLFASPAQAQCSRTEIEANIAKFKDIEGFYYPDDEPAFRAVSKCGSEAINPLTAVLEDKDALSKVRSIAVDALEGIGQGSQETVVALIAVVEDRDDNSDVRWRAANALGSIGEGSQEALKTLISVLKDKNDDSGVRWWTAGALGSIGEGSREALKTLISVLKDKNNHPLVRGWAAEALGGIEEGSQEALKTLISVLKDKNDGPQVRWRTANALGKIGEGSQEALKTLISVLKDRDDHSDVRANAASALGSIEQESQEVLKTLIALLEDKDDDYRVRSSAALALGSIEQESQEVLKTLIALLEDKDDDYRVRFDAASVLGKIGEGSQAVVAALTAVVENKDDDFEVRERAAYALGEIEEGLKEAAVAFIALLEEKDASSEVHSMAASALVSVGSKLQKSKRELSAKDLEQFITSFETALTLVDAYEKNIFRENQVDNIRAYLSVLKMERDRRWLHQILPKIRNGLLIHIGFWVTLIFLYPKSPQLQAIFFWNPKIRKLFGLWYVDFALTWVPLLRHRLFTPFQDSLLSDADLESFDPNAYYPDFQVELKSPAKHLSLQEAIPEIKGEIVLEGESGLGKSMFLKSLVVSSKRIVVYLPAKKCENGVMDAIAAKLHGYVKEDPNFLQNLIYSGAMDICIDGLNEVTPDTRAKITSFVERYFKGNIILATQPLEWTPPSTSTARIYRLQPLKQERIEWFLVSRQNFLPENASVVGSDYTSACQNYLADINAEQQSPEEKKAVQRMLSNPMELTIVSQMLARREKPDLLNLQQQQYNIMAADYQRIHLQSFPLAKFAETAYEMRLKDESAIPTEWLKELKCLERYKMVVGRQFTDIHGKTKQEWYFRHDKIQEFFIVQTFLGEVGDNRLLDYMGDPRFRGVYFFLATMMPVNEARELRETLIQYAADTKDHTVSDTFIQLFRTRQLSAGREQLSVVS